MKGYGVNEHETITHMLTPIAIILMSCMAISEINSSSAALEPKERKSIILKKCLKCIKPNEIPIISNIKYS